jgi:hypothetical protein
MRRLQSIVVKMVHHCATSDDVNHIHKCAAAVIGGLENEFKDAFFDVAKERGYCTSISNKMSAAFWTALSVKANLQTTQQREIAKYLQAHFGSPVVVPKKELASYGSTFVDYEIFCLVG